MICLDTGRYGQRGLVRDTIWQWLVPYDHSSFRSSRFEWLTLLVTRQDMFFAYFTMCLLCLSTVSTGRRWPCLWGPRKGEKVIRTSHQAAATFLPANRTKQLHVRKDLPDMLTDQLICKPPRTPDAFILDQADMFFLADNVQLFYQKNRESRDTSAALQSQLPGSVN